MSKPSASALFEPRQSQAVPFDTSDLTARSGPKPFLAWDDAATYASAAWLPPSDPQTIRKHNARRFVAGAVVSVLATFALAAVARSANVAVSECRVTEPPAVYGTNAETQMLIRGGVPCPIWTRIARGPIKELAVTLAPKNGSVTPRGRTGVVYRPATNYRGSDVFEFAMRGQPTSTVRVNVTVE
jgi:hypothetical protein